MVDAGAEEKLQVVASQLRIELSSAAVRDADEIER